MNTPYDIIESMEPCCRWEEMYKDKIITRDTTFYQILNEPRIQEKDKVWMVWELLDWADNSQAYYNFPPSISSSNVTTVRCYIKKLRLDKRIGYTPKQLEAMLWWAVRTRLDFDDYLEEMEE